jgi:hypothetical protein
VRPESVIRRERHKYNYINVLRKEVDILIATEEPASVQPEASSLFSFVFCCQWVEMLVSAVLSLPWTVIRSARSVNTEYRGC